MNMDNVDLLVKENMYIQGMFQFVVSNVVDQESTVPW